jgi:hypothetical protein
MLEQLTAIEVSEALKEAEKPEAHLYASIFSKRKKQVAAWGLLQDIFEMGGSLADAGQPFAPMVVLADGRRSFIPDDLEEDQIEWLRQLEADITDPEFCARISDIIWLRKRDAKLASRAIEYYLASALSLEDLEHWTESVDRYTRAYRLATQLNRKGRVREEVLDFILERLRLVKGDDPRWWTLKLVTILYEARHGEPDELIGYAEIAAQRAAVEKDFRRQRDYLDIIVKLYHRSKNTEAVEEVRVQIARSFREEAEAAEAGGSGISAYHHWEAAVRAYRERPSLRAEVPEIQARLAAAGRDFLNNMKPISHQVDIRDLIEAIREDFGDQGTDVVIYKLVFFALTNGDDLRREVEGRSGNFFSSMFSSRVFDYEGRTVAVAPGAMNANDPGYEERIRFDVQRDMQLHRSLSVHGQIIPALRVITEEHIVDFEFLMRQLADSAFIPGGRLEHVARGLAFGFAWEFSNAVHVLIPQFEAGLRSIALAKGVIPRNLHPSGVEEAWGLDRLLSKEGVSEELGETLTFEIRSLLIEEFGPKFRHNLSHGLIPPEALAGVDAVYAWWIFLRLCVIPTAGFNTFARKIRKE